MNEGFIKLSRKFFAHPLWNEKRVYSKCEAWLDLIQMAKIEKTTVIVNGKVINLSRGQLCASIRFLSERWGFTAMRVRTFISMLKTTQMITTQQHNNETVITLVKYSDYNDKQHINQSESNTSSNKGVTRQQQDGSTNNKNIRIKEEKEEKKEGNFEKLSEKFSTFPYKEDEQPNELRILTHGDGVSKTILWRNRKAIYNGQFKEVIVSGGSVISEYGGFRITTKEFSKYLTDWCSDTGKKPTVWILFALYCDINEKEYFHIEKDETYKFEALYSRFESHFKDTIE